MGAVADMSLILSRRYSAPQRSLCYVGEKEGGFEDEEVDCGEREWLEGTVIASLCIVRSTLQR